MGTSTVPVARRGETDMSEVATAETAPRLRWGCHRLWRHRQPDGAGRWRSRDAPSTAWQIARGTRPTPLPRSMAWGRVYDSIDDLIASPDIDAIYLTHTAQHAHHLPAQGLAAGKHVLCEKAITLNSDELDEARTIAAAHGVVLMDACTIPAHAPLQGARASRRGGLTSARQPRAGELRVLQGLRHENRFFNP